MSNDLLPINATPQERAISETISRISSPAVPARHLWDPKTCPADLLPWLAWSLSVDEWNAGWSEQQKRDTIAASFLVHRTKGTAAAVRTSLAALGYDLQLTEWWQAPAEMPPYTFSIGVDTDGGAFNRTLFADAMAVVDQAKNARSHLARLRIKTKNKAKAVVRTVSIYGATVEVFDDTINATLNAVNRWHNAVNYEIPGDLN